MFIEIDDILLTKCATPAGVGYLVHFITFSKDMSPLRGSCKIVLIRP
jgi:hypothetical protein